MRRHDLPRPPFNSNRNYNVLFKSESGADSEAQITAFEGVLNTVDITTSTLPSKNLCALCVSVVNPPYGIRNMSCVFEIHLVLTRFGGR